MKKMILILAIFASNFSFGAVDSLIMNHAPWKYRDNGQLPPAQGGNAWTAINFSESLWLKGNSQLGYGEGDEQKVVSFGPDASDKYVTTYFRKSFNVNNPALYNSLTLNLICDDGAVVYLNGVEIVRENMPAGAIAYATGASVGIGIGENDWLRLSYTITSAQLIAANLTAGRNVISVEIHQFKETTAGPNFGKVTSTDVSFNLKLAGNLITPPVNGDSLVNNNSYWHYFDGGVTPPGTNPWYANNFVPTNAWAAGNAELGYGDTDEETIVGYGGNASNKYVTTYLRRGFDVAPGASYPSLALDLVCDDGAVVYLNGVEIYRLRMPAGVIGNSTLADPTTTAPDPSVWENTVNLCNGLLLSGQPNVIAVEIHQLSVGSSDISFNLRLRGNTTGSCPVTLTRNPYLQMIGTDKVIVRWQTSVPTNSRVSYGTAFLPTLPLSSPSQPNATLTATLKTPLTAQSTEHEVLITGLIPDTKYFYQVGYQNPANINFPNDNQTFFKTALPAGTTTDFTAWVTGDFGTGLVGQTNVRDAYVNYAATNLPNGKADIWLWLGDNAYDVNPPYADATPAVYTSNVFNIYPNIMKNTPFLPAVGNHDYANVGVSYPSYPPPGISLLPIIPTYEYFNAFTMPENAELGGVASATKRYYSYNYGNVHFIVLDSYGVKKFSNVPDAGPINPNSSNPMYTWLKADLMVNTKKWTVCFFHHPPYTMGTHNSDNEPELTDMRQNYASLLETYNVDLVLSGHSHVYERSFLLNGHYGFENEIITTPSLKINPSQEPFYTKSINGTGTIYAVCGNSGKGGLGTGVQPYVPPGTIYPRTNVIYPGLNNGYPHEAMAVSDKDHYGSMILTFRNDEIEAKYLQSNGTIADNFKITKTSCITGVTVEESKMSGDWHTTSTWGCGTIPTTNSVVEIKSGHIVTLGSTSPPITAITADIKKIYVFGMLRYLNNSQLKLKP